MQKRFGRGEWQYNKDTADWGGNNKVGYVVVGSVVHWSRAMN